MVARRLFPVILVGILSMLVGCIPTDNVEPAATFGEAPQADEPVVRPSPGSIPTGSPGATDVIPMTPTPTPWVEATTLTPPSPDVPHPTATPVPPFPGMIYETEAGLWRVADGWQAELLSERRGARLSPDGTRLLFVDGGDVWVEDRATGEAVNVTADSGRTHGSAHWWSARPETLLLSSRGPGDEGPNNGYLTLVNSDGGAYRVVGAEEGGPQYAQAAASPDGKTVAFDAAGSAMLLDVDGEAVAFDFAAWGLSPEITVARAASPAWAPHGKRIAWVMAVTGGGYGSSQGWEIVVGVFDLEQKTARLLHPFTPIGRGGWFAPPLWSPDGTWLAFHVEALEATERGLWVLAGDGSEEKFLGPQTGPLALWSPPGNGSPEGYLLVQTTGEGGTVAYRLRIVPTWAEVNAAVALPENAVLHSWRE